MDGGSLRSCPTPALTPGMCGSSAPPPRGRRSSPSTTTGENQIIVSPGANSSLTADDVEAGLAAMQAGDVLVLQLEIPTALVRQAARIAEEPRRLRHPQRRPRPRQIDGLLDDVDLLVVNEQEIQVVAELAGIRREPPGAGPDTSACPRSGHRLHGRARKGPLRSSTAAWCTCPATKVAAKDTTGAGDTFVGYLAASLAGQPRGAGRRDASTPPALRPSLSRAPAPWNRFHGAKNYQLRPSPTIAHLVVPY